MTHVFMTGCMTCTCLYVGDGLYVRYVTVCVRACVRVCVCVCVCLCDGLAECDALERGISQAYANHKVIFMRIML